MSATHSWLGAGGGERRACTRSAGRGRGGMRVIVVRLNRPRRTPCRPSSCISRCTVQRATRFALAVQLLPHLAGAVDTEVAPRARGRSRSSAAHHGEPERRRAGVRFVVGGRGDRQDACRSARPRSGPCWPRCSGSSQSVGRSSSAAKKADADLRISWPGGHAACLATVWPQPCEDGDICRRTSADDRCLLSREDATLAYDRGCLRTRGDVLLIRRLWVRVPPPELRFQQVTRLSSLIA